MTGPCCGWLAETGIITPDSLDENHFRELGREIFDRYVELTLSTTTTGTSASIPVQRHGQNKGIAQKILHVIVNDDVRPTVSS